MAAPIVVEGDLAEDVRASLDAVLEHYEALRVALAADDLAPVGPSGEALAKASKAAQDKAPKSLAPHLGALETAATSLAKEAAEGKGDIEAVRKAMGDVSQHVVALLASVPALQEGRTVFSCPMAQGYPKWVQTSETMANPYMGKKMLACGSKSSFEP